MSKYRDIMNRILNIFNRFTVLVDFAFILHFINKLHKINDKSDIETVLYYGLMVLLVVLAFKYIRATFYVIKSAMDREIYLLNNRVVAVCGKQRVGKTSMGVYFAKYGKKVYTNTPMKIKRKYTNKLTTDILTLKTKIDDNSLLVIDEANLFYNNTMSHEEKTLYGQALLCQCVGHFFDGNIIYIATDVDRMPKIIRDEWATKLQVIRSKSYHYSFVGDSLLKLLYFVVNGKSLKYTGLRIWEAQQYEKIQQEQYISLLGKNEGDNKFSPFYQFADYQNIGVVEYDDRYMNKYYTERIQNNDEKWNSLQLNTEDFGKMYDGLLAKYIKNLDSDKQSNIDPKSRIKTE